MTITITSTNTIGTINGMPCRFWVGTTDAGVPVRAFIAFIGAQEGHDLTAFEAELIASEEPEFKPY